jgi:hypothetical protein
MRSRSKPAAPSDPTAALAASHPSRTVGSDGSAELPDSAYAEIWRALEDEAERELAARGEAVG